MSLILTNVKCDQKNKDCVKKPEIKKIASNKTANSTTIWEDIGSWFKGVPKAPYNYRRQFVATLEPSKFNLISNLAGNDSTMITPIDIDEDGKLDILI